MFGHLRARGQLPPIVRKTSIPQDSGETIKTRSSPLARSQKQSIIVRFAALPGSDGHLQDEEGAAGGGGVQPGPHPGPPLLPGHREKDVRPAEPADPRGHPLPGNQTLASRSADASADRWFVYRAAAPPPPAVKLITD